MSFNYDWQEPKDRPDAYYCFTSPAEGPLPTKNRYPTGPRGRPFTDAELAGVPIKRFEPQPERKRRVPQPMILTDFGRGFEPMEDATHWVREVVEFDRDKIVPRTAAGFTQAARIKSIIDGLLAGATQTEIADAMQIGKDIVSRDIADLRRKHRDLANNLGLLSALNRQNRELVPTLTQVLHTGIAGKSNGCAWSTPYIWDPVEVKLLELYNDAFPPEQGSGFLAELIEQNTGSDCGAWVRRKVKHDECGYEISTTIAREPIWSSPHGDIERLPAPLLKWIEFRKFCWLAPTENLEDLGWRGALYCAEQFFKNKLHELSESLMARPWVPLEIEVQGPTLPVKPYVIIGVRPEHRIAVTGDRTDKFKTLRDDEAAVVTYRDPDNGEIIAVDTPIKYKAPYTQRLNHCPPAKKIVPALDLRPKGKTHQPFSNAVYNHGQTKGVNGRFDKIAKAAGRHVGRVYAPWTPRNTGITDDYLVGNIFHDHPNRCAVSTADLATRVKQFARAGRSAEVIGNRRLARLFDNTASAEQIPVGAFTCTEIAPLSAAQFVTQDITWHHKQT